jgi:pimeloyl-ACP methyl ester carboxylesterase
MQRVRPRLLLVPQLTELEWLIRPQLEEWAEIAYYDAPGVGDEPPVDDFGSDAVARRGIEEIERRGWDRFFVVADEFGVAAATSLAVSLQDRVEGIALGHARLSNSLEGERPAVNKQVHEACVSLMRTDYRTFVHQLFKLTGGEDSAGGFGEDLVEAYMSRVPVELDLPFWERRSFEGERIGERMQELRVPMLLARHRGCLLFTDQGFEDAVASFPHAVSVVCAEKPGTSPDFAEALHKFCLQHATART